MAVQCIFPGQGEAATNHSLVVQCLFRSLLTPQPTQLSTVTCSEFQFLGLHHNQKSCAHIDWGCLPQPIWWIWECQLVEHCAACLLHLVGPQGTGATPPQEPPSTVGAGAHRSLRGCQATIVLQYCCSSTIGVLGMCGLDTVSLSDFVLTLQATCGGASYLGGVSMLLLPVPIDLHCSAWSAWGSHYVVVASGL